MKRNKNTLASGLSEFRSLSSRVNRLMRTGAYRQMPATAWRQLLEQLQQLYLGLSSALGTRRLRRVLAGAAVLIGVGVSQQAAAQVIPQFAAPVTNPFGLQDTMDYILPELADLDGDGDLDVLTTSYYGVTTFFENTGTATAPAFAAGVPGAFGLNHPNSYDYQFIAIGDVDGDGDLDIISANYYGGIDFRENIGTVTAPLFAAPSPEPFGLDSTGSLILPELLDLDDDGDLDFLGSDYYGNFHYYENTGTATAPQFALPVLNPFGLSSPGYVTLPTTGDLDQDGDYDIMVAAYYDKIYYYENTGTATSPQFAPPVLNPFGTVPPNNGDIFQLALGDLDGDGDLDLLGGQYSATFTFQENAPLVSVETPLFADLEIGPNPADQTLRVRGELNAGQQLDELRVLDVQGRLLRNQSLSESSYLDLRLEVGDLSPGVYMLELRGPAGRVSKRFVKQ